jgi:Outer membrane protein beta-barrel domain
MKKKFLLLASVCLSLAGMAQTDTTAKANEGDTIHIGNMIIIKSGKAGSGDGTEVTINRHGHYYRPSNISTNWLIIDLGFANYNDKTNYASASAQQFAPGSTSDWFNLRNGKSVDVNIWLFMQRLNLIQHVVNLKYGLGAELNNYRYNSPIIYSENPGTLVTYDSLRHFKKDKLAADYVTAPLMLNFNFTPHRREGFGLSVGASAGYLYSSHQKIITAEDGKQKKHDDFDLNPWKISWIGELQLGPVKLYGSYATQSMFKKGLDQTPYTVGIRLSNW